MYRLFRRLSAATLSLLMVASLCGCGGTISLKKIFGADGEEKEVVENPPSPIGALSWATGEGVTIVEDEESLNERVRELYEAASGEGIELEYKNEAYSTDGKTFACYIGNSSSSHFPMFITIYADSTYQEELFVSGLIKPGQAFNQVTLTRPLTEPKTTLPICYTQVFEPHTEGNDTDDFTIRAQTVITLNFNVVDEFAGFADEE